MAYILQVDFPMNGPFGEEMAETFAGLAESINQEEGFIWKVWTENPETKEAGGIYLFETRETAKKYIDMHMNRLAGFGIIDVRSRIFAVNDQLTSITGGPLQR
ncbi:monooxygenase [Gracilibacillus phocaeensis]|uniref:monooxygenase n=1 Tax=Gracilibacillus phocaeensis TaxID=2042304 RepID=UPI0010311074|nr:monooxygenase [Gracilibacillus phocaeensis]